MDEVLGRCIQVRVVKNILIKKFQIYSSGKILHNCNDLDLEERQLSNHMLK